ncbi:MAG: hypothetical protein M0R76_10780 [Proteobacteria bacterium]|nr:hypothetical protein [Pseudomonadota bacterium]
MFKPTAKRAATLLLGLCLALALPFCSDACSEKTAESTSAPPAGQTVRCPVCDLEFDAAKARAQATHDGTAYYFLLEDHQQAFVANPHAFLESADTK